MSLSVLFASALLVPPPLENVADAIDAARRSTERIVAFHVYTRIEQETIDSGRDPHRPAALRLPRADRFSIPEAFEDRFDRRQGRSRLRFLRNRTTPSSAHFREVEEVVRTSSELRFGSAPEDLLWALQPSFGEFELLELLEKHPASRLTARGDDFVIEIPAESLVENWEFGARVCLDRSRDFAISGFDVYRAQDGGESLILRTDIEHQYIADRKLWFPTRVVTWQRISRSDSPNPDEASALLTHLSVDASRSSFNEDLARDEIVLTDWRQNEAGRTRLRHGWVQIQYQPGLITGDSDRFRIVLAINFAVLVLAFVLTRIRKQFPIGR